MKLEDSRLSTNIIRINANDMHEIILTTTINGEFKNFNQIFIENKYATYTEDKMLLIERSDELYEKFKMLEEINSPHVISRPKMARKPTVLDKEIKYILKNFDKTFKTVMIDRKHSSFKNKFTVMSCTSPDEIWVTDAYNSNEQLTHIQSRLVEVYSNMDINKNRLDDFSINSLCVWKHFKYNTYKRGKIVETNVENDTFKVR